MKLKRVVRVENSVKKENENESFEALELGRTAFDDIYMKSVNIAEKCKDYIVNNVGLNNFTYSNKDGISKIYYSTEDETRLSEISTYALSQLCNKIGIPFQYMKRCLDSDRKDLVVHNVNSWISNSNKNFFIREYDNKIRGILSPRYSVLDTNEILEVVGNIFPIEKYDIKGYYISPERFHVRFVSSESLNISDEDLFPGISIDSSDVGRSHLNIDFFIWKQVCTNGLIVPKRFGNIYSKRHMGLEKNYFKEELTHALDFVDPLIAKVTASIIETSKANMDKFFKNEKSIENLVSDLMRVTGMKENGANKVIELMKNETYPMNRWGLINSITQVAQDYTLEKRLDIEKSAGELLIVA